MNPTGKSPQPPLLFLACLLVGWGLGCLQPLPTRLPHVVRLTGCVVFWLGAAGLGGWAILTFRRWETTPKPNGVASALLTSGPFRFTRNPLYLMLSALMVGFGLLLNSIWLLLMMPVLVFLLDRLVIAREEARLRKQFGTTFEAYTRRVRRWL